MSLHCLAILGSKNEPLFLCASPASGDDENNSNNNDEDVFGFLEESWGPQSSKRKTKKPSIRYETMIHASLDRLEELLGSTSKKATSYGKFQRNSHWLGSICPMEEFEIYGYVTSSDVKILALIERDEIIPIKKRKEIDIKILFTSVHECFVKYSMNPFTKIRSRIEAPCDDFEEGILVALQQYNNAVA